MDQVYLKIYGDVHGVGFRYQTKRFAESLSLTGLVRNAPNRIVEVLAQGEKQNLEKLISWVRHSAPGSVTKAELQWLPTKERYTNFQIL